MRSTLPWRRSTRRDSLWVAIGWQPSHMFSLPKGREAQKTWRGWVAERSKAPVLKTAAAHLTTCHPIPIRLGFRGFRASPQRLHPGLYCVVPASWVPIWVPTACSCGRSLRRAICRPNGVQSVRPRGARDGHRLARLLSPTLPRAALALERLQQLLRDGSSRISAPTRSNASSRLASVWRLEAVNQHFAAFRAGTTNRSPATRRPSARRQPCSSIAA
jgi:hypothetical protein